MKEIIRSSEFKREILLRVPQIVLSPIGDPPLSLEEMKANIKRACISFKDLKKRMESK